MKNTHVLFAGLVILEIFLLFFGCQGDNPNILTPSPDPEGVSNPPDLTPDTRADHQTASVPVLWGLYSAVYNLDSHSFEVIPLRGPAFAVNVVHFLQPPAGSQYNMGITVLDDSELFENGNIDVRVNLHHPFPGQEQYTGFDVCGIFITESSFSSPMNPNLTCANPEIDPNLHNPDGYTRWMNPTEFLSGNIFGYVPGFWGTSETSENSGFIAGATLNPYKYFAHTLGPDMTIGDWLKEAVSISKRGMFPCGSTCSRDYELNFPPKQSGYPNLKFNYAVLANWAEPLVTPVINPEKDFPPDANAQYPLHIIATDNSEVYYTSEVSGGTLSFDLEIFDWGGSTNPKGIPGEVQKFTVWSDESLVPGGYVEIMSTEEEWNSGFVASTSVVTIDILGAVPEKDGESWVWVEIESSNPTSYDQGFDADVPTDPLASYVKIPITVSNCPKAFMDTFETNMAGQGSILNNAMITGTNFVDGDALAVWLETSDKDGQLIYEIQATDVQYVDAGNITADFDLTDAPYGIYDLGCVNGCGEVTTPEENQGPDKNMNVVVVPPSPVVLTASTQRTSSAPENLSTLLFNWGKVTDADYYNVYVKCYDPAGNVVTSQLLGSTNQLYYNINLDLLPLYGAGLVDSHVTAHVTDTLNEWESMASRSVQLYFHGFETGLGAWSLPAENPVSISFIRSSVNCAFKGTWGVKAYGFVPSIPALWAAVATPPIKELDGATTVKFELLHRHMSIFPTNGYQVGWCDNLPTAASPTFTGYNPILESNYGYNYNDSDSTALQSEYGLTAATDANFSANNLYWNGWYLSGFDASEIIGDGKANYIVIGLAGNSYNLLDISIDEVAVLLY